ncbi:hypothetical protein LL946_04025 [Knoellia locipacati]|uniref:hypothetical protein n=1 Tax=Knoellia locipacati TaxID=882824 RepID=UPI00384F0C9D
MVNSRPEPTRDALRQRLLDLLSRRITPEEAADWAAAWVRDASPDVKDQLVWDALKKLSGADLRVSPDEYLHSEPDFHAWLDELEEGEGACEADEIE